MSRSAESSGDFPDRRQLTRSVAWVVRYWQSLRDTTNRLRTVTSTRSRPDELTGNPFIGLPSVNRETCNQRHTPVPRVHAVQRRRSLRTESGRFHGEILSDAAADQPGGAIGGPVDRRIGVHGAGLRLDMARAAQIDRDGAEELTMCGRLSSDHDVYRADLRFVRRDGPEDAVLCIRAFLVGDWSVNNGNPDSHCRHEGKLRASGIRYGVSLYCFIFRQSVTVLIFRASAARFRLPLKRSSARRINSRSCDRIFKGSPSGAPFFF